MPQGLSQSARAPRTRLIGALDIVNVQVSQHMKIYNTQHCVSFNNEFKLLNIKEKTLKISLCLENEVLIFNSQPRFYH